MKAIVVLTRGYEKYSDYSELIDRNKHIEKHMKDKDIDIIIFHEGNIVHQEEIKQETPTLRILFVDIKKDGYAFCPEMELIPIDPATRMYGGSGYRHMCSFWFVDFWHFVKKYDQIVRIDEDCKIVFDPERVFESLSTHSIVCACYQGDGHEITKGLGEHSQKFLNGIDMPYHSRPIGGPYTNVCGFSLKDIQKSRRVGEYIQSVKLSNKIYIQRWGDLSLWGEVIHYLLGPSCLKIDQSLVYYHGSHDMWVNR